MSGIPRIRRRPGRRAGPGGHSQPPELLDSWAGKNLDANPDAVAGPLSFWRIVPSPFAAWVATLERWQLTAHDGQLRLGHSVLRGPADHDQHFGTCRIEVRLARGPLRPRVRMQLHLDQWSATATAVELIPYGHSRPGAAYFQSGRGLLDSLTCAVAAHAPAPRRAGFTPRRPPADQAGRRTAMPGGPANGPAAIPARQEA